MPAASDRLEFAPPPQPGMLRAFVLALLAHLLLLVALTFGLRWNRESQDMAAEAELWSSVPQQAAPREVTPPPPPPPPPAPPQPVVRTQPPPAPAPREADIALEREKERRRQAEIRRQEEEQARQERERRQKLEAQRKAEEQKKLEAQRKAEEQKKLLAQQRRAEEQKKLEEQKKQQAAQLAAENRRKEEERKRRQQEKEEQDAKRLAQLREENLRRIQGLAGASGSPSDRGSAAQSSGPSASWAGRVRARVRPNIVFTDDVPGNPTAEVEVRMAPDGTITGRRLVKSSGHRSWDDAVLRALDKTEVLPRDVDGRVHSPVIIEFRPKG